MDPIVMLLINLLVAVDGCEKGIFFALLFSQVGLIVRVLIHKITVDRNGTWGIC